jgi:translocation and assembly module TamA
VSSLLFTLPSPDSRSAGKPHGFLTQLWLCLLLLFSLPGAQAQTIAGYEVRIVGAGEVTDLLNEHLQIRRYAETEEISLPELQRLVDITPDQIRQLLATEGYFSPAINHRLEQVNGRWVATFSVAPGPRTYVNSVNIRFRGHIANEGRDEQRMNRLRQEWGLPAGEPFTQEDWNSAKDSLLADLLIRNYPAATIASSEARIDPEGQSANLTVEVDSGPAFTFGELEMEGLERYSRAVVEAVNPINPGDPYTQEKLNELQARLQDTGYFRSVFATVNADPENPKQVPVQVTVNEYERKRLSLGIGFSTDSGPRLEVRWLNRNLQDRDWRLESNLLLDQNTRAIGSELFFQPLEIGWAPSVGVNYERREITGETTDRLRASARLSRLLPRSEQLWTVTYYSDQQRIGDELSNNRQALMLNYGYKRRRIDNPLTPRRGHVSSIEVGVGPGGFINEENILRVTAQSDWFIPVGERWTGILRGKYGQVYSAQRESVPSDLLFRAGGDQSVRGYDFNSLGVEQSGAIVGGRVLGVVSAELIYHITSNWGAAVFTDAGDAADSWDTFELQHGTGVGARWRSPVGPVNLDIARAHESGDWSIHFSIGYGF